MARPIKKNADYFSHDNDMRNDPKVKYIRNLYWHEWFSIYVMLLEYMTYCDNIEIIWNEQEQKILSWDFWTTKDKLIEIVNEMIDISLLKLNWDTLYSSWLKDRLQWVFDKRDNAKELAKKRWWKPKDKIKRDVSHKLRWEVFKKWNYECNICKNNDKLEIDHILELSNWWDNNIENLQLLCNACHKLKTKEIYNKKDACSIITATENMQSKVKESKVNNNKEFKSFLELKDNSATYYILKSFVDLWYIPSKAETIESFRDWVKDLIELHKISSLSEFKELCEEWKLYWKTQDKKIKNHKTTFMNSPILPNNKKKYAK